MRLTYNLTILLRRLGGYFGAGWFRDIWRIPEYVKDVNNDESYLKALSDKMRDMPKPPIKVNITLIAENSVLVI